MAKNLREGKSPLDLGPPGREEAQLREGQAGLKLDTRPDSLSRSGSVLAEFVPIVPDHELIRRIGAGSYGEVWLARNVVGTHRAVKVVYRKTFEHDRPYEREFGGMQKFEPVSRTHEGLVNVLQIGRNNQTGYFYYIMELADGEEMQNEKCKMKNAGAANPTASDRQQSILNFEFYILNYRPSTLDSLLRPNSQLSTPNPQPAAHRLPVAECVRIGLTLTSALAHLHRHELVHRDIKPSNILIIGGVPKLADIGLVADTSDARSYVGTEGFIPPEGPGKPQADLYSLGKVLYEISTGKDRHDFPDLPADLRDSADQSGFSEMNEVILKACASDVAQRYQSAEEMQADLALLQEGKSVKQERVKERRWAAARKIGLGLTALAVLILLLPFLKRQSARERPIKPEALGLYTDGWGLVRKGGKQNLEMATLNLEKALKLDPAHPKIYAVLGLAYGKRAFYFEPTNQELESKAEEAADKAGLRGPNLAETLHTRGYLLWFRPGNRGWRHHEAIESFQRLLDLYPNLDRENPSLASETHQHLSGIYLHIGLLDEALREAQTAAVIDPLHSHVQYVMGQASLHLGKFNEAVELLQRVTTHDVGQNYANLALAYLNQNLTNEACAAIQEGLAKQPLDPGGQYASVEAMLFARGSEFAKAEEAIRLAEQRGAGYGHFHHTAYNIACAYALMNKPKPAVDWLQRAVRTGFACYPAFRNNPALGDIKSDPEFQKFLAEQKELWIDHTEFHRRLVVRERPMKPEALGLYTDGWALLRKGGKQDFEAATSKLEQALVLDPAHPKIYALLGLAYGKRAFFFDPTNQELQSQAEAAADKASALGPNLPETLFTRGYLLSFRPFNKGWRYQESIESFQRLLDLHPNLDREDLPLAVETHYQLSTIYTHIGLLDEALREAKTASAFEPLHSRVQNLLGMDALYRGEFGEAVERFQRVITADAGANYANLALAYFNQNLTNEARAAIQEGLAKQPLDPGGQYASVEAMLFARAGEFAKAEEAIRIAEQRGVGYGHFHHTAYSIACAYALMNKPKPAVEWLQTAVKTGFACYPLFRDDAPLESIRSAPEFQKFLDEQKLLWTGYKEFHQQLVAKSGR